MNDAPYFWIRKITSHLREHDQIPLFGAASAFNWPHFSSTLAARLGVHNLSIRKGNQEWRSKEDLIEGLGQNPIVLPLQVSPLSGMAYWIMPKESVVKITSWMMNGQIKMRPFSSNQLMEGFYHYLMLQSLDCISLEEPFSKLSIILNPSSSLPQTDAFCIDVDIEINRQSHWARLIIDPDLQKSWRAHFAEPDANYVPTKITQITELTLGVKIGSVELLPKEYKRLKPGDFVSFDRGNYQARKETGAAYLMIDKTPLFQVKIKNNKIELIDYAFMYEEEMDKNNMEPTDFNAHGEAQEFAPASEEAVTLKELPVNLVVELARFRITLEKLIQLLPGNLIELPIKPNQPVHLTVNGQLVGKAELVHLGESLGIRILELG